MGKNFELDLSEFMKVIGDSADAVDSAVTQALDDIKDDWIKEARDIAPVDSSNLRRQIDGELEDDGIIITANATNESGGKPFNYAYYIHELDAGGKSLKTSGTEKKFLEKSEDVEKWEKWLQEEVEEELRKAGW